MEYGAVLNRYVVETPATVVITRTKSAMVMCCVFATGEMVIIERSQTPETRQTTE